jgi:hypothetical protein
LCGHCLIAGHNYLLSTHIILVRIINDSIILIQIAFQRNKILPSSKPPLEWLLSFKPSHLVISKAYLRKSSWSKELFLSQNGKPVRSKKHFFLWIRFPVCLLPFFSSFDIIFLPSRWTFARWHETSCLTQCQGLEAKALEYPDSPFGYNLSVSGMPSSPSMSCCTGIAGGLIHEAPVLLGNTKSVKVKMS